MTSSINTLSKAARYNMLLVVRCRRCGKEARFLASDLIKFYSPGRSLDSLPFKCRECDVVDNHIRPMEFMNDRTRETIVWRPVKVKM